jgi:hypothetical protein
MVRSERIAWRSWENRAQRVESGSGDIRETGAALDAGEEGGDEDCVEGEVG